MPYFSGKSQEVEITFDNFGLQAGVIKRIGYFSTSAVAPYTATPDGFYLENDGTTYRLVVWNNGVPILNLDWTLWIGYSKIQNYNWNNFTIIAFDYLWLGGSDLKFYIQLPSGTFELIHTYEHAGNATGTFTKSPNQPLRYEIRSTSGLGSVKAVCSQVSTEGSLEESGESIGLYNTTSITCKTIRL